ncbi:MAG: ribosome silencing factor [Muribaculaceae bacterium]|nr:ribosome silencing factor [Muribaculaceae bacterium]
MSNIESNKLNEIIEAITDRKGKKISLLNLNKIDTAPSDSFVICQGNSTSQVSSIADSIRERLQKNLDIKPYNYDGYKNSQWIIIDYGDIMVHVFLPEYREFYSLEDLWSDASITNLPDLD